MPAPPAARPLRVTHLVPALFARDDGVIGGAERYAYELARHMAAVTPTTLVSFGRQAREETDGDLRIRVLRAAYRVRGQASNPFGWRLPSALADADVVHCHQHHILATSAAAAWCRVTGRRVFVSDLGGGGWDVSGYISTDSWFHGHLHISGFSRSVAGHDGDPRAHVIYGGVDTERFQPDPATGREPVVAYVGRVLPHKGIDTLIEALPPGLTLEIIGHEQSGHYLDDLRTLSRGRAVTFRHEVDDDALVHAYRRALCVVLPSVFHDRYGNFTPIPELLGQTLLEGMACGTPAVCTDVASMPEVVRDGRTGFVVPARRPDLLRTVLERVRNDPALVDRMGRAARAHVLERFRWSTVVRRCLEVYHGL